MADSSKSFPDQLNLWRNTMGVKIDDMVDSFLGFPDSVPQTFQDYQLARHLLWTMLDTKRFLTKAFRIGIEPGDFRVLWIRLMPCITGEFMEPPARGDNRISHLDEVMFEILRKLVFGHDGSFDGLMDQVVAAIRGVREMTKK